MKTKLDAHGDGPFLVLERISENAYKIILPGNYNVHTTFNVSNLSLFELGEDSRTNIFKRGREDMTQDECETMDSFQRPITRARAKEIKERTKDGNNKLITIMDKVIKKGLKLKFECL